MKQLELKVELREKKGRGACEFLRRQKRVPAILYGPTKNMTLSVEEKELISLMRQSHGGAVLVKLTRGKESYLSLLREVQRDSLKDHFIHVDFQEVLEDKELYVSIPVHFTGESVGVKNEGGLLVVAKNSVQVACLPKNLPEFIEVSVANLSLGQSIHVADLPVLQGVRYADNKDIALISCSSAEVQEAKEEVGAGTETIQPGKSEG